MTYGMSLRVLLEGWLDQVPDVAISGITQDSCRVEQDHAFVAVQSAQGHGMDFVEQAVANGCAVVIHDGYSEAPDLEVPVIRIPDLAELLGQLASRFWAAPSDLMTIAGVTGTHGKASVTHFLAQAWQRSCGAGGMIGTLGCGSLDALQPADRTTPDVFRLNQIMATCLDEGVDHVAMEVSSHALEQRRCQTVQFDAAVLTSFSCDHLDHHTDMRAYEASKKRLFTEYAPRFAIINQDDPVGRRWIRELGSDTQVLSYGLAPGAECMAEIQALDGDGMSLRLDSPWGHASIRSGLLGQFNAANLLAAAGTLALLGMSWDEVVDQLEMMEPVPGRMLRLGGALGQPLIVIDCAHTPDALQQALTTLRAHLSGRLVCVFGCGGNRDRGKRAQMGRVAEAGADRIFVTSDNPRFESPESIVNDVLAGFEFPAKATVEPDRAAAIMQAISTSGPGDVVLIAGKGHEAWQETAGKRIPFSDEAVVRVSLERAA